MATDNLTHNYNNNNTMKRPNRSTQSQIQRKTNSIFFFRQLIN